jgi:hypothetical protein
LISHQACSKRRISVLHPHLGISWFRKLGADRAETALIIFKNAFDQYQASATTDTSSTKPNATSDVEMGFLDDICMADVDLADNEITAAIGEYDRFLAANVTFPKGDANRPLEWWKVSILQRSLVTN